METFHLIGEYNKPPKRNRADGRAPPPSGAQARPCHGTAADLGGLALRLSPLWHVDGRPAALSDGRLQPLLRDTLSGERYSSTSPAGV